MLKDIAEFERKLGSKYIKPRDNVYFYAHGLLKCFFLEVASLNFFQSTKQHQSTVLDGLWRDVSKEFADTSISFSEFNFILEKIDSDQFLMFIQFPNPIAATEPFFVAGFLRTNDALCENKYYTLELSHNQKNAICEWTNEGHSLFGFTSDCSLDGFKETIYKFVDKNSI